LRIDKLEAHIKQCGIPRDDEGNIRTLVEVYAHLGEIYMIEGDLLNAERYYQRYLDIDESGDAHLWLARLYIDSGDLQKAKIHLEEADAKLDPNKEGDIQPMCFIEKARVNYLTGISATSEVNSAIELIEKHLEEKEYITSYNAIRTYIRVADSYFSNLDFNGAKKYYSKVSEMSKIVYFQDFQRAECLMKLIQISCIEGDETEHYKMELDKLVEDYSQHEKMGLYQRLAEGTILKHIKGKQMGISRFKAQEIFEKIAHGKIYDINLHFFASFNYCELLLDAFQLYEDDEIFKELYNEMEDLTSISKEKGLILYHIDALILRSKKATLQKDLVSALEYLEEAQELADTRKLKIYQDRIRTEKQTYLQNLDSWNSMRKDDKIEKLRLKQYLKFAQQNITK
jgi:tetratricopeptide (TPR) repeat protein